MTAPLTSCELILMLSRNFGSGTSFLIPSMISNKMRVLFSRLPPYLSVLLLILGETN